MDGKFNSKQRDPIKRRNKNGLWIVQRVLSMNKNWRKKCDWFVAVGESDRLYTARASWSEKRAELLATPIAAVWCVALDRRERRPKNTTRCSPHSFRVEWRERERERGRERERALAGWRNCFALPSQFDHTLPDWEWPIGIGAVAECVSWPVQVLTPSFPHFPVKILIVETRARDTRYYDY